MRAKILTVIRQENYNGVIGVSSLIKVLEQTTDIVIDVSNHTISLGDGFS